MIDEIVAEDVRSILNSVDLDVISDKKVLVTGGAGFIGSYLCDVLVKAGAKVTCLDNFSTGIVENIDHLKNQSNFTLFNEDVVCFEGKEKFDYILHFASRASPEDYQVYPIETLLSNSIGSYRLLELAKKNDSVILFASTSEVYGSSTVLPTPETYWGRVNPIGIRSCYDEGKRFGEAIFTAYHRKYGLDTRIVRIHNTYGPRLRADGNYGRALPRFVMQALKNEDITVYGDGSQTRSFCYISDTVRGILLALLSKKMIGEVVNIGSSAEITICELTNKIIKFVRSNSRTTFHPFSEDDPKRRWPDISKAKGILDWTPNIGFDEGISRTIKWFREVSV